MSAFDECKPKNKPQYQVSPETIEYTRRKYNQIMRTNTFSGFEDQKPSHRTTRLWLPWVLVGLFVLTIFLWYSI